MIDYLHALPGTGAARYSGKADDAVRFTLRHQLLDAAMWHKFVDVFKEDSDAIDDGWRCEFWGKTIRGGCLTYQYTGDETLYNTLRDAVEGLLAAQRPNGAFSTYPQDDCWKGWDIWGRKYVLTGLLHFYRICREEALKKRVLAAATAHAERLFDALGEGKINITETSTCWGGVNSCSVLEPIVDLYKATGDERCLAFARYILSTGGCKDGNLIELAAEDRIPPYEYPEVKAYETISFFEGVLAMYEVTGDRFYLDTVEKFAAAVKVTDITAIGCAGCTHELFDHSAVMQTVFSEGIMQETCVTVTWMRFCARLFLLTGKESYVAQAELSAYNALYGAMNDDMRMLLESHGWTWLSALPFDSYSPLVNGRRGRGVGGLKYFRSGGFYGCCACIASAGTALLPLLAVTRSAEGIACNTYLSGSVRLTTPTGKKLVVVCQTYYPAAMDVLLTVSPEAPERFSVKLRVPGFVKRPVICVNGQPEDVRIADGYATLTREWRGDAVTLTGEIELETEVLNGMTAFRYGVLTLARDAHKEPDADLGGPLTLSGGSARQAEPEAGETVRFLLPKAEGGDAVLTDYASCGKRWDKPGAAVSVWQEVAPKA